MPGKSPGEAVKRFLDPIKDAVGVLGPAHLAYSAHPNVGEVQVATVNQGSGMWVDSSLYDVLRITISLNFVVVSCQPDDPRGPYRCSSRGYILAVHDAREKLLIAFHYHPLSDSSDLKPHMHIGEARVPQADELHVPTPRVTVEEFISSVVDSFGVEAAVEEDLWRPTLEQNRATHERWRSWHHRADAPTEFP